MKSYSMDLRERLVAGRARGQSAEELARQFKVSKRSVERYWSRQQKTGSAAPKQRGGYRRSRLAGHEETLRTWIEEQNDLTLSELQQRLQRELAIVLSVTALWNRLQRLGLSFKKKRSTPPNKSARTLPPPAQSGARNVPRGKRGG
jgi:transposase